MVQPKHAPVKRAAETGRQDALTAAAGIMVFAAVLLGGLHGATAAMEDSWQEETPLVEAAQNVRMREDVSNTLTTTEQLIALAQKAPRPEKLADAEETIDDNAIVHGTLNGVNYTVRGRGVAGADANKVTLAAVGDQLASDAALAMADANAGEVDDGLYDFNPWYKEVGPLVRQSDLRFINQETVMIGTGEYGYAGYPSFNTPPAAAQAIAEQGFNLVNFTTNHTYDYDTLGIERSHEVWAQYPQLLVGGSYLTAEDRQTVHMIERNGITFAFLCYTYGDNRFDSIEEFPNVYYSCGFDYAHVAADIQRAKQVADCVIVGMHWGTEYTPEPNDQQREWAQWLADQDVDLVLGTHAHTIQPVEYVEGSNGNKLLVVFGLSDFISGWDITAPILSGVFTCDMASDAESGRVRPENPVWHPTIEWSDGTGSSYVRLLANMDRETTNANIHTPDVDDDFLYTRTLTEDTITQIPIDWGESGGLDQARQADTVEAQAAEEPVADDTADEDPAAANEDAQAEGEGAEGGQEA